MPFFVLQRIISALQPELALLLDFLVTIPLSPSRLCCPSLYIGEYVKGLVTLLYSKLAS